MQYIEVPKNEFLAFAGAVNIPAQQKPPSFWDVSKWPEWWEKGAADLEKSAPGKIITSPVRIIEAATGATTGILKEAPKVVNRASWTIPIIGIAAAIAGAGYLAYKFKKNKPEKLSSCH
jgi:hypothetical protein